MTAGRAITPEQRETILRITSAGGTYMQAATAAGVSRRTVERLRRREGLSGQPPGVPYSPEEDARARILLADGCSYNEVARTLGRDLSGVIRRFPGYGWTRQEQYDLVSVLQRARHTVRREREAINRRKRTVS